MVHIGALVGHRLSVLAKKPKSSVGRIGSHGFRVLAPLEADATGDPPIDYVAERNGAQVKLNLVTQPFP
jgi:hypothetical protein